jgi:hypothetical protein
MATRWLVAPSLLALACVAVFAKDPKECADNAIDYAGTFRFPTLSMLNYQKSGELESSENETFSIQVQRGPAGPLSYVINKFVDNATQVLDATATKTAYDATAGLEVNSICVAPPHDGAGMLCVDVDDAGMYNFHALEVDDDCKLTKAWATYTEPMVPDCENELCNAAASYRMVTREA